MFLLQYQGKATLIWNTIDTDYKKIFICQYNAWMCIAVEIKTTDYFKIAL